MSLHTKLHTYYFNISKEDERLAYDEMCKQREGNCFRTSGEYCSSYRHLNGKTITLSTKHFWYNQWNTDGGVRVFDWAESIYPNRNIKAGHYLDITDKMRHIRAQTFTCGFCAYRTYVSVGRPTARYCNACLGHSHLTLDLLPLLELKAIPDKTKRNAPIPETLIAAYTKAQTTRRAAETEKERIEIQQKYDLAVDNAKAERDGFLWLLNHGIPTDNAIFYNHTREFCFGWRRSYDKETAATLRQKLVNFPAPFKIEGE